MAGLNVKRGATAGVVVAIIAAAGTATQTDPPVKTFTVLIIVGLVAIAAVVAVARTINRS
jgi:hypothetical protein